MSGSLKNWEGNLKICRTKYKWKHNAPEPVEHNQHRCKTEVYSRDSLHEKIQEISHKIPDHESQGLRKTKNKLYPQTRKEIINIGTEINEIETDRALKRINVSENWYFKKDKKTYKLLFKLIKRANI